MQLLRRAPHWVHVSSLAALVVTVVLAVTLLLVMLAQAGRIVPGTSVVGVDLGGEDRWGARRALTPALAREERRPLAVSVPGERLLVRPTDLGLTLDVDASVDAALAHGRSGPSGPALRVLGPLAPASIAPRGSIDDAVLAAWVDTLAGRIERTASAGDVAIDADRRTATVIAPHGSLTVDRAMSVERLRTALLDPDVRRVELAVTVTPPPATRPTLEGIAVVVDRSLKAPMTLHHEGRRLTIEPEILAELLTVRTTDTDAGPTPTLTIASDRAERLLGTVGRRTFDREAADAVIVTPDLPPTVMRDLSSTRWSPVEAAVEVVPGQSRVTFGSQRTARQIVDMVLRGVRSEEADLLVEEPELTTDAAVAGRPTHLLATFTTSHPAGAARTVNIRLLADLLDDSVVAPGEEFSVNATSGPRRCEDGFVPAGTIIRGELVDTCGGGVSQFGTTLMNAVFFAGLPLDQWQPHSFFISRYPAGREATLSYPELDVRFTNDTDGYVVIRTSHTPDSITVSLYGVPRWSEVRADHGDRRAPTDYTEVLRATDQLAPGARRVIQSGGGGFTITVTRTRTSVDAGAETSVERWTTVYRPQQRIVEIGVGPVSPAVGPVGAAPPAVDAGANGG